jgi:hypothetical protein
MAKALTYQQELVEVHKWRDWPEIETVLGLKHTTEGKTLRRYLTGKRTPSQPMREKIHALYQETASVKEHPIDIRHLKAHLYAEATGSGDVASIQDDWQRLLDSEYFGYTNDALKRALRARAREERKKRKSPAVMFIVDFNYRAPRANFKTYSFVTSNLATERWLLLYFLFTMPLTGLKTGAWSTFVDATLADVKIVKPSLYAALKGVNKGL